MPPGLDSPALKSVRELPSYSWSDFDRLYQVKAAIRELEQGRLYTASMVVDAMERDDRLAGALLQRTKALSALQLNFTEGLGGKAAAIATEVTDNFQQWCSAASLTEMLKWGVMLGISFGQMLWEVEEGRLCPRLKVWHPMHAYWRWDTRSWWMVTEGGVVEVKGGDGQWVVFAPYGEQRAWMQGAVRSLYVPWLLRQWTLRDWGRWGEVYGSPIRKVTTPAASEESDKQRFLREVAQLGASSTIRLPTSADPNQRFDVELVEATSTGYDGFDKLLAKTESSMAIALLGQNLSTEVTGGSHAAASVHASIRNDILESDAKSLAKCLHDQFFMPWANLNYGDPKAAPLPVWVTAPPEDRKEAGDALKSLGDGIKALFSAGAKPDTNAILDHHGVPVTGPAEEPAPPPAPGAAGEGPGEKEPPTDKALAAMFLATKPSGALRGQAYADAVADKARERATQALKPDVMHVLGAVAASNSYDELKGRLIELYGNMEPSHFAVILQRAMLLAELAGRLAVLEDT
jgi:phage gp29-like protein